MPDKEGRKLEEREGHHCERRRTGVRREDTTGSEGVTQWSPEDPLISRRRETRRSPNQAFGIDTAPNADSPMLDTGWWPFELSIRGRMSSLQYKTQE